MLDDSTPVAKLRNVGQVTASKLCEVGVLNLGDLKTIGADAAFERILVLARRDRTMHSVSVNLLYALWGAIHDVDWRDLPEDKKTDLRELATRLRGEIG
ncbi:MAG TPA: competence protein TfoX [Planctomycetaceae bacterium]|nr:competence protein TfoX [Planctomycetaceae bacterium]